MGNFKVICVRRIVAYRAWILGGVPCTSRTVVPWGTWYLRLGQRVCSLITSILLWTDLTLKDLDDFNAVRESPCRAREFIREPGTLWAVVARCTV